MKCRIIKISNNAAVVMTVYSPLEAFVIDAKLLPSRRVGDVVSINVDMLTPYGIDWSVVYPDGISISCVNLQDILYSNGIVSLEDLKSKPIAVRNAMMQLVTMKSTELYNACKSVLEE